MEPVPLELDHGMSSTPTRARPRSPVLSSARLCRPTSGIVPIQTWYPGDSCTRGHGGVHGEGSSEGVLEVSGEDATPGTALVSCASSSG